MIPAWEMEVYERIRVEIVKSAVNDLQKAMRKSDRIGYVCEEQKKLEAWFLSGWGQMLCGDNGEYILNHCRRTYKTNITKKGKRRITDDVQRKICEDYKSGMRYKAILQKYNISAQTLYDILRRWKK